MITYNLKSFGWGDDKTVTVNRSDFDWANRAYASDTQEEFQFNPAHDTWFDSKGRPWKAITQKPSRNLTAADLGLTEKKRYWVALTASGSLTASACVFANNPEEAKANAVQQGKEGNLLWKYDGCDDSTIEAVTAKDMETL